MTPPMGWNSWNHFLNSKYRADIQGTTEKAVLQQARALVDTGMAAAGYQYVVMDDCFQAYARDHQGRLQGHPFRFPNGIKYLADEIHALGLKFGIYSVPGSLTCAQQYDDYHGLNLGSINREEIDAIAFAEWGVDYLKYDWCRAHINDGLKAPETFRKMADLLAKHAPEIVYSISEYGLFQSHLWAPEFCNMWRTTDDLVPHWDSLMRTIDLQEHLYPYSKPGHWNDPDMLQVGNGTLTESENRAHMFMWAILNAPLMAGNDLTKMNDNTLKLLTHNGVIAINQDWGGSQGKLVHTVDGLQIWEKPMSHGGIALVLLNRSDNSQVIDLNKTHEKYSGWKDVYLNEEITSTQVKISSHDAILLEVGRTN
jgi:hypothetical protein